jgi:hypothetical protein
LKFHINPNADFPSAATAYHQRRRLAPPPPLSAPPLPTRTDAPHRRRCLPSCFPLSAPPPPSASRCCPCQCRIHEATAHHAIPQRRRRLSSHCPFRLNSRQYHELLPEQGVATTTSPSSSRPLPPCACLFQWWCSCPWWWMVRQCVQHF